MPAREPQSIALAPRAALIDNYTLANILRRLAARCVSMDSSYELWLPSPGPWVFEKNIYGISHCLIDRDGRVIGSHLGLRNGPLMAEALVMAALLRKFVAGDQAEALRTQAAAILGRIDRGRTREPGEDDE